MNLKSAILEIMPHDRLKTVVNDLEVANADRRRRDGMRDRLSKNRHATPDCLLEHLNENQVKEVCEIIGIDSTGRRKVLVQRLLGYVSTSSTNKADLPEPETRRQKRREYPPRKPTLPDERKGKIQTVKGWRMTQLAQGARLLPAHHITIRVPWHDSGWAGTICACPRENTSCLILPRIGEGKRDEVEAEYAGERLDGFLEENRPPCFNERAAFMAPFELVSEKRHPYTRTSPTHSHFSPTRCVQPPYSAA